MKAEHRKELETNALADRVGRAVQGMKQAPQKRTVLWLVLIGIVVVVAVLFYRRAQLRRDENSMEWLEFAEGSSSSIQQLLKQGRESNPSKAVEYELRYMQLRETLRTLATNPKQALAALDDLEKGYQELATTCKDDKVLLPEALYSQAVIEETRIIRDDDKWKAALAAYKDVAVNHKESAFGKLARQRVELLENKDKRDELLNIYRDLRREFVPPDRVPDFNPPFSPDNPLNPLNIPPVPTPPDLPGVPK
jgi:hypothetical protein